MVDIVIRPDVAPSFARALFNTSQVPLLLFDSDLRVLCVTPSFCTTFGISEDRAEGRNLSELGGGEWNIPELRLLLENALVGEAESGDYEASLVRPGSDDRRLTLSARCLAQEDTPDMWVLLAVSDVTDARRVAEANVALLLEKDGLLRERAVLLQEMQHRVANSLQIIASILMLKARVVTSEESRHHLEDAHQRVMSVAAVQSHLHAMGGVDQIEVGPYLTTLCASLAASMIGEDQPIVLKVIADHGMIGSDKAVSIGLIVTELVINAVKYAFPASKPGALVHVTYESHGPDWKLIVSDNGVGKSAAGDAASQGGLGTIIVKALVQQLDARMDVVSGSGGTSVSITRATIETRLPQAA